MATKTVDSFSLQNATLFVYLVISVLFCYYCIHFVNNNNNACKLIEIPRYGTWKPYSCSTNNYTQEDARSCMQNVSKSVGENYIAFVGDRSVIELFYVFINLLGLHHETSNFHEEKVSVYDKEANIRVEYFWSTQIDVRVYKLFKTWCSAGINARPRLIVTGSPVWKPSLKPEENIYFLKNYEINLTYTTPYFDEMTGTDVMWKLLGPVSGVQEYIDMYNNITFHILSQQQGKVQMWSSPSLVSHNLGQKYKHYSSSELRNMDAQMLVAWYCSKYLGQEDNSCCSETSSTSLFIIVFAYFLTCGTLAIIYCGQKAVKNSRKNRLLGIQRELCHVDRNDADKVPLLKASI